MSTPTEAPIYPPSKAWRTIRGLTSNFKVGYYQSQENRDAAAQKWANKDQDPVICESWTEDTARNADPINAGWAVDLKVEPACICPIGRPGSHMGLGVCGSTVHEKTGYCLTHQHIYRQVNGLPEPVREVKVDPRTPEEIAEGHRSEIRMWFASNPASFVVPIDEQIFGGLVSIVPVNGWDNFNELSYVDQAIMRLYPPVLTTQSIDGQDGETMDWHVMPTVLYRVLQWNHEEIGLHLSYDYERDFTEPGTPTLAQVQAHADDMAGR